MVCPPIGRTAVPGGNGARRRGVAAGTARRRHHSLGTAGRRAPPISVLELEYQPEAAGDFLR
ncbi:hypothetical protein KCP73_04400 [Salmonella enterica subsp. enterica]|nr:hypothetical protein KCP73_04400 [Salmonella enterica subsp. enterica]